MTQMHRRKQHGWWKDLSWPSKLLILVPIILVLRLSLWLSSGQPSTASHQNQDGGLTSHKNPDVGVKMPESKSQNAPKGPKVTYMAVADADPDVLRYAAMEEGGDGSMLPLTIYRWAHLMAHEDSSYARELALSLTTILKVSG
jgi:hypothetical protein